VEVSSREDLARGVVEGQGLFLSVIGSILLRVYLIGYEAKSHKNHPMFLIIIPP
jgi:hypothetical protein